MKTLLAVLILATLASAQINNPSTGSSAGGGAVTSGMVAEYRMTEGAGTTLTDTSGNGNNATFHGGANNPTWIAGTGGLSFTPSQWVDVPAAVSGRNTVMVFVDVQPAADGTWGSPISSNVSGAGSFAVMLQMLTGGMTPAIWCAGAFTDQLSKNYPTVGFGGLGGNNAPYGFAGGGLLVSANDPGNNVTTLWVNNQYKSNVGASCSTTQSGSLQIGGSTAGQGTTVTTYLTGRIYYVAIWNRALSNIEVNQHSAWLLSYLQTRGISPYSQNQSNTNILVADGDSITAGLGAVPYTGQIQLDDGPWSIVNFGLSGATIAQIVPNWTQRAGYWLTTQAKRCVDVIWAGGNDIGSSSTNIPPAWGRNIALGNAAHAAGCKAVVVTSPARTTAGFDANKDAYNTVIRQQWTNWFDGFADVAADANLGADGAAANATYFQGDGVHPTSFAQINNVTPVLQRSVNRVFGNHSWSTANIYTTTAATATAITAASESTNTVTLTMASNPFVAGQTITVAGVTPAGYNGIFFVQTANATQVTYFNSVTGLGAGTVFGTAASPTQKDADVYVRLGGSATSPSFTLQSCVGYTGQNLYLKNENTTSPWVLTPFSGETIDGAASLTMPTATSGNNPVVILQSFLTSASAGGCSWKRLQ